MNKYLQKFIENQFQKPGKALDLGAGDFKDVYSLKKSGWQSDGIDLTSGTNLEYKFIGNNHPYDLIYSNYVLHKIKNKEIFIKTIFDNLKTDGFVFLHTFDTTDKNSSSELTKKYIHDLFSKQKFKNIKISMILHYDNDKNHNHWHKILQVTANK